MLALYLAVSLVYSFRLKREPIISTCFCARHDVYNAVGDRSCHHGSRVFHLAAGLFNVLVSIFVAGRNDTPEVARMVALGEGIRAWSGALSRRRTAPFLLASGTSRQ